MFIVGELGGLALIKNAINQGRDCVDQIAGRVSGIRRATGNPDVLDLIIVGAGREVSALRCERLKGN